MDKDKDYEVVLKTRMEFFITFTLLVIILISILIFCTYLYFNMLLLLISIFFGFGLVFYYLRLLTKLTDYDFIEYIEDQDISGKIPIEFDSAYYGYINSNGDSVSNQFHLYIDERHICELSDGKIHNIMVDPVSKVEMKVGGRTYGSMDYRFIEGERYVVESAYNSKLIKVCFLLFFPCMILPIILISLMGGDDEIHIIIGLLIGVLSWITIIVIIAYKNKKFGLVKYNNTKDVPSYFENTFYINLNKDERYSLRCNDEYICKGSVKYQKVYVKDVDNLAIEYKNNKIKLPMFNYIDNEYYKLNYSYASYLKKVLILFIILFLFISVLAYYFTNITLYIIVSTLIILSILYSYIKSNALRIRVTVEAKDKVISTLVTSIQKILK